MIHIVPFGDWQGPGGPRLTAADREILRAIATTQRLPAGTVLFDQGAKATSFFNILHGVGFSERQLDSGQRRGIAFLFPGDLCGLAQRGLYVNSVTMLTDATVLRLPVDTMAAVLQRNAGLQFIFLSKAAHVVRAMQWQMLMLGRKDPLERVALFLSTLRRQQERDAKRAPTLPLKVSQIASYLDLSVPAVTRALDTLAKMGVVDADLGSGIDILDARKLQRIIDRPGDCPGSVPRTGAPVQAAHSRGRPHRMSRSRHARKVEPVLEH